MVSDPTLPPEDMPGTLPPGEASVPSPGGLSDIMAMATGRGTVKLMDMRQPDKLRVVELTPDEWRAVLPKLDQAMAVAEGRHASQAPQTPGAAHPGGLASSADAPGGRSPLRPDGPGREFPTRPSADGPQD